MLPCKCVSGALFKCWHCAMTAIEAIKRAENDIFVFAQPIMSTPGHVLGPLTPALGARVAHKIWNFDPLKTQIFYNL